MIANFIQYLRPNGRQKAIGMDVANDLQPQLDAIKAAGCRLECEVLMTGTVSLTIFHCESEEDIDIELVANGPDVPHAVDSLIRRFENATKAATAAGSDDG